MRYSPVTGRFYSPQDRAPSDAIDLDDNLYMMLAEGQLRGDEIAVDESGVPYTRPAVPVVPTSVSPAQARLALLGASLLDRVEAIVAAADLPTQIAWNTASVIERGSPTVAALSAALGLTEAQLDDLFTTAASIFV